MLIQHFSVKSVRGFFSFKLVTYNINNESNLLMIAAIPIRLYIYCSVLSASRTSNPSSGGNAPVLQVQGSPSGAIVYVQSYAVIIATMYIT